MVFDGRERRHLADLDATEHNLHVELKLPPNQYRSYGADAPALARPGNRNSIADGNRIRHDASS